MRRMLSPSVLVVLAACGTSTVQRAPMTAPVAVAVASPASDTVKSTPPAARPRSRPVNALKVTPTPKDSAADAAALDSLNTLAPADALPDLNLAETPVWDLNVADYATHPRVQYFLDYFTGRGRDRFQIWLGRMAQFEPFVRQRLIDHSLPGDLVYLALIESGFSTQAVSSASAVGMWQFMAATGRGYGLHVDSWVDERRDPIHATDAASRHLADLTAKFGSPYLAAAAYNAGAGRVERSLGKLSVSYGHDDDSLDLSSDDAFFSLADTRLLKTETKDYVPKLIAAALIAKEPAKYGFEPVDDAVPFSLDSVIVDGGTGLDLIARLADTSLDALHELNPNLLRMVTPPDRNYTVRVPTGTATMVAERYAAMVPAERRALVMHTVKTGETLTGVAKEFGSTAEQIRAANRSLTSNRLPKGRTILVPLTSGIPAATLREPNGVFLGAAGVHVVKSGETVSGIARRYGISMTALRLDNRLTTRSVLQIGQKLRIRGSAAKSSAARVTAAATVSAKSRSNAARVAATRAAVTHVVQPGETISVIAAHFKVSQASLITINGLGRSALIKAGQTLKIPPS